jgi:hypothetical protein
MAAVWSSLLLHHFPKLDRLPEELARITKDRLAAVEPNAGNVLSWFAFNVVNVVWGLSTTTRNPGQDPRDHPRRAVPRTARP